MKRTPAVFALLSIFILSFSNVATADENLKNVCKGRDPDAAIPACTKVLAGKLSLEARAETLFHRGAAYQAKNNGACAFRDWSIAIKTYDLAGNSRKSSYIWGRIQGVLSAPRTGKICEDYGTQQQTAKPSPRRAQLTTETASGSRNAPRTVARADTTTPSTVQQSNEKTAIPFPLLAYKYAPQSIDEKYLLTLTRNQIVDDQWRYKNPKIQRRHPTVFSADQVVGRVPNFAVNELLPVYKRYLSGLAAKVQTPLSFSTEIGLNRVHYSQGAIRAKGARNQDFSVSFYSVTRQAKINLPPLGQREVLSLSSALMGGLSGSTLPKSLSNYKLPGRVFLGLDRQLRLPPVAMDAKAAEHLWRRPNCLMSELQLISKGATLSAAKQAAKKCQAEIQRYKPRLTANVDIEPQGVRVSQGSWILLAKVLEVKLLGTRNELLATYSGSDLAQGVDEWQAKTNSEAAILRKRAEAKEQKAAAARQKLAALKDKEVQRKESAGAALSSTDIVGLRLGMTIADAEKAIRDRMGDGWAVTVAEVNEGTNSANDPSRPYAEYRVFVDTKTLEQIAIFVHPKLTDRVLGISRIVPLSKGTSFDTTRERLTQKYGKSPVLNEYKHGSIQLIWTAELGVSKDDPVSNVPGVNPFTRLRRGSCNATIGRSHFYRQRVIDGTFPEDSTLINKFQSFPTITVWGEGAGSRTALNGRGTPKSGDGAE